MRSTIKDVARKANVSTATVSLVVHDNKRISPHTRKKVLKTIEDLNYRPSHTARGLVSRKNGNIGFILTEDHFLRTEPFYTQIYLGSEFEARKHPYYIILATVPNEMNFKVTLPRFVAEDNVDGIIIAGKIPENLIRRLLEYKIPLVLVDYYPTFRDFSAVLIDNLNGGRQATEHLISCGHKNIAFIGGDMEHPSIRDRYLGYKMALEQNGIMFNPSFVVTTETATSRDSGYHAAETLLAKTNKISSLFACNDAMAIGAMQLLKDKGVKIPEDISIIGFDDIEGDPFQDPPITTMRVPMLDMGSEALRLMSECLNNSVEKPKKILMPVEIVIRGSTC